MKVKKFKGGVERKILIALLTNTNVCAKLLGKIKKDSFPNPAANLVAQWSLKYFEKYGKPIRGDVEQRFATWADKTQNETLLDDMEVLLDSLSTEYESKGLNEAFLLDEADKFLKEVALKRLAEQMQGDIQEGEPDKAIARLSTFTTADVSEHSGLDVFAEPDALRVAFETKQETLIKYPDGLGKFLGSAMERDGFVSFMAPEKRGKTYWLIDTAWRAVLQRLRVAFFSVGDMSQNQMLLRMARRAANRPLKAKTVEYPVKIELPEERGGIAQVQTKSIEYPSALTWKEAMSRMNYILKKKIRSKETRLKLFTYPNSTINVAGIRAKILDLHRQNWEPDVIVIDYADILAPPSGVADTRDQINATWKQLRSLSQEFHILVVTATQADAASYGSSLLSRRNFTDDKRKLAHVTAMIGINATEEEKQFGLFRLNHLAVREDFYSENIVVHCASCLDCAKPAVLSIM